MDLNILTLPNYAGTVQLSLLKAGSRVMIGRWSEHTVLPRTTGLLPYCAKSNRLLFYWYLYRIRRTRGIGFAFYFFVCLVLATSNNFAAALLNIALLLSSLSVDWDCKTQMQVITDNSGASFCLSSCLFVLVMYSCKIWEGEILWGLEPHPQLGKKMMFPIGYQTARRRATKIWHDNPSA